MSDSPIQTLFDNQRTYFRSDVTRGYAFRIQQLKTLRRMVDENEDAILDALKQDLGKPALEGFLAEIQFMHEEIDYTVKNLRKWMQTRKVKTPMILQAKSYQHYEPLGTVLIISPWNYPFQLLFAPLIGAIAAGNTAILKPSELAPAISKLSSELVAKYFDPQYVTVVEGAIEETTQLLDLPFDHIFYTGSTRVGSIVMAAAAKHLTPVVLELGGKSPCIVDQNVNMEVATRRIAWAKFLNAGQTCVAPDYILVHESRKDEFVREMGKRLQEFYSEHPQQSPDFCRIVNDRHYDRLMELIDASKVAVGGNGDRDDLFIAPTVMENVTADDKVMQDEIFGPILPVLTWNKLEEVIDFVRDRPKPLALYVFSTNKGVQEEVLARTSFGGGCVNEAVTHLGNFRLPFGGVGDSGMGAYHGKESFVIYSHRKSVLRRSFRFDIKLRYPPYKISLDTFKKLLP